MGVLGKSIFKKLQDLAYIDAYEKSLKFNKGNHLEAEKFTVLDCVSIKANSVVSYPLFYKKRYNDKSLDNLQNVSLSAGKPKKPAIKEVIIRDVNEWFADKDAAAAIDGKPLKRVSSRATVGKLFKYSSVFVRSVLSRFRSIDGFRQRSLTFATFTLSEPQKHTDKVLISMFVNFIDHLKKVDNPLIDPVTKERTVEKGLVLENYVWKAETQENGNIHFHLIGDCFLNQDVLRRVWNNYLQNLGYKYAYNASNVQSLRRDHNGNKIGSVENYLCKYMTKPPLRKEFRGMPKAELAEIPDDVKYCRPVLGQNWGASARVKKLDFPKFYNEEKMAVMAELRSKLAEYKLKDSAYDAVKVYCGNVRKALRQCTLGLQKAVKEFYQVGYAYLYGYDWDCYDEIIITYGL